MKKVIMVLFLLCLLLAAGCGEQQVENEEHLTAFEIYDVNKDETRVGKYECKTELTDQREQLNFLFEKLMAAPSNTEELPAITKEMELSTYSLKNGRLTLNFGPGYAKLSHTKEVLTRAAIVKTVTQVAGIDYVAFTVDKAVLLDAGGTPIGIMTADQFIDNEGIEINDFEKVEIKLYFADETGKKLTYCTRDVLYNSNISMEKFVIDNVIKGPLKEEGLYPTVNPDTKIISVTVKDAVCYINISEGFLSQPYDVSDEVVIYSLVNSITELTSVNKVQISINGKTDILFRERIPLDTTFERNLEIVE